MAVNITPEIEKLLNESAVMWFTTVRADGMPQPTPVWFIWEQGEFLVYSVPAAYKVRNIQTNSKVALNPDSKDDGRKYVVFMGEAVIDPTAPKPSQHPAYFRKYEQGITDIGMTPESFDAAFTAAIRIRPERVRGEG